MNSEQVLIAVQLYLLHNPTNIGIESKAFTLKSFIAPITSHHSLEVSAQGFSAATTADNTIRWRRSPSDPTKLQSNSRIIRWSDGSLTLQIGSSPLQQHELPAGPLANPQLQPRKPVPASLRRKKGASQKYDPRIDVHTYLATVHESLGFARVTNHLTATLSVKPSAGTGEDDAILRLQEKMATAAKGNKREGALSGLQIVKLGEDPELRRRQEEQAEKEKDRAAKQKQSRLERDQERSGRALGRVAGYGRSAAGGLTASALEDEGEGGRRKGAAATKPRAKPRRRRDSMETDEDDGYARGKTKEDEYDVDDGFLVGSDEDVEEEADDDEEEEELADDKDVDAEGDDDEEPAVATSSAPEAPAAPVATVDDEAPAGGARTNRRRVVDDEDEE